MSPFNVAATAVTEVADDVVKTGGVAPEVVVADAEGAEFVK